MKFFNFEKPSTVTAKDGVLQSLGPKSYPNWEVFILLEENSERDAWIDSPFAVFG
jgi:hypothetical protein